MRAYLCIYMSVYVYMLLLKNKTYSCCATARVYSDYKFLSGITCIVQRIYYYHRV